MTAFDTINRYNFITMAPTAEQYFMELAARQASIEIQAEYVEQVLAAELYFAVDKI